MNEQHDSIILHFLARTFIVPLMLVLGVYVLVHGEFGPGGGFQAGAIVAAGILLGRLTLGAEFGTRRIPTRWLLWTACTGAAIYIVAGIVPLFFGMDYLNYDGLPVEWLNEISQYDRTKRLMGILIVETGVFLAVSSTLVLIYDYLSHWFRNA